MGMGLSLIDCLAAEHGRNAGDTWTGGEHGLCRVKCTNSTSRP
jgi:hypothetical protein